MNNQNNFQNNGMNNPQQQQMGMQQPVQPQMGVQQPQMGMQQPMQQPQQPAQPSKLKMSLDEAKQATKTQKQNALNESAEKLGTTPKNAKLVNIAIVVCIIAFAISLLLARRSILLAFSEQMIVLSGILVALATSFLLAPKSTRAIGMVSGFGIVTYNVVEMIIYLVQINTGNYEGIEITSVILSQIAWILLGGIFGTYFMLFFKNPENGEVYQSKPTQFEKMTNFLLLVPIVFALISKILDIVFATSELEDGVGIYITNSIFYFLAFALATVVICGVINRDKLSWIFVTGTNLLVIFTFIFRFVYANSNVSNIFSKMFNVYGLNTTIFIFELLAFLVFSATAAFIMMTVYKRFAPQKPVVQPQPAFNQMQGGMQQPTFNQTQSGMQQPQQPTM